MNSTWHLAASSSSTCTVLAQPGPHHLVPSHTLAHGRSHRCNPSPDSSFSTPGDQRMSLNMQIRCYHHNSAQKSSLRSHKTPNPCQAHRAPPDPTPPHAPFPLTPLPALPALQTWPPLSCLRAFALAIPSAGNAFLHMKGLVVSLMSPPQRPSPVQQSHSQPKAVSLTLPPQCSLTLLSVLSTCLPRMRVPPERDQRCSPSTWSTTCTW